jgi:flavorubredoxin
MVVRTHEHSGGGRGTALVLFDSWFGNTEAVARALARGLGDETEVLAVGGFVPGRRKDLSLIVVGGPTHRRVASPTVRRFLMSAARASIETPMAVYDTRLRMARWKSGSASRFTARALRRLGARVLSVESFLVEGREGPMAAGELLRAEEWGRTLRGRVGRSSVESQERGRAA